MPHGSPINCREDLTEELGIKKVAHLIDISTGSWNRSLIDFIFCPAIVANILGIPLSSNVGDDVLIWPEAVNGNYSSKLGYNFMRWTKASSVASSSSQPSLSAGLWKKF